MARILGIDLGTTNSAVAVLNAHGEPEIIPNREGEYITPSVVFFEGDDPVVGSTAKHSAALDPQSLIQFVKRQMGDPEWTFVSESGQTYKPEDISAIILRRLKEDAERALNETFTHAVITVPAYFNDAQRQATKQAGEIAGFKVPRIINEPTAAALAYGVEATSSGKVMVYDLGGGTFDVTILEVAPPELKVLATGGDKNLGGFDWDNMIMEWLNERFMEAGGIDLLADAGTEHEVRDKAERAKIALSQMTTAKIVLSGGGRTLPIALTREQFEEINHDLLERTQVIMEAVLEDARLKWSDISKILLVGGLTRMKAVPALIERVSGRKPSHELHPDEVVALGAAIQAGKLALELPEFRPKKQDIRLPGDQNPIVPAPTIVGGISLVEIKLTDVSAHSMGIIALNTESQKEENYIVLERNTAVPCFSSREFFTLIDNQESLTLRISQGEESDLNYVDIIGEAEIRLPFSRPARTPFSVKFSYDIDGLLHVTLTDPQTGQSFGEVKIERKANMTQREVNEKRARLSGMVVG